MATNGSDPFRYGPDYGPDVGELQVTVVAAAKWS